MEDSDGSKIKEAEVKYHNEEVKDEGLVEEVTMAAKSLMDGVTEQSSSYVTQVESLISDPWTSLKNLSGGTDEALPTSDKGPGEASEAAKEDSCEETAAAAPRELEKDHQDDTAKDTHTQQVYIQDNFLHCSLFSKSFV